MQQAMALMAGGAGGGSGGGEVLRCAQKFCGAGLLCWTVIQPCVAPCSCFKSVGVLCMCRVCFMLRACGCARWASSNCPLKSCWTTGLHPHGMCTQGAVSEQPLIAILPLLLFVLGTGLGLWAVFATSQGQAERRCMGAPKFDSCVP